MTKEYIHELWKAAQWLDEQNPRILIEDVVEEFAKKIMLEGAKKVCVDCSMFGPSIQGNNGYRYHEIQGGGTYKYKEPCRATSFYLTPNS